MRIRAIFYPVVAPPLAFCSAPAFALDGRGGGPCGASLFQVMFNPILIVIALAVTVCAGSAIAASRSRRESLAREVAPQVGTYRTRRYQSAPTASQYRIFSKPAVIIGLCAYLLLLGPVWVFSNLCF
jgi:hypothetical protein